MKSISEWLRTHKLGASGVVVTDCTSGSTVALVQGGKVVGATKNVQTRKCPTCGSAGFPESVLGANRCTFCDGTEGGNPPSADFEV